MGGEQEGGAKQSAAKHLPAAAVVAAHRRGGGGGPPRTCATTRQPIFDHSLLRDCSGPRPCLQAAGGRPRAGGRCSFRGCYAKEA